jgi:hypothetical protein
MAALTRGWAKNEGVFCGVAMATYKTIKKIHAKRRVSSVDKDLSDLVKFILYYVKRFLCFTCG